MRKLTLIATALLLTLGLTAAPRMEAGKQGSKRLQNDQKEIIKQKRAEMRAHKAVKDDDEDPFEKEPAEVSTIELHATQAIFEADHFGEGFTVTLDGEEGQLLLSLITAAKELPTGEFDIKESDEESEEEYVLASEGCWVMDLSAWGIGLIETYEPSYMLTADGHYYFLESGKVKIEKVGENTKIEVEATSAHGSTIKTSFEGDVLPIEFAMEPQEKKDFDVAATGMLTEDYTEKYGDAYVHLQGEDFSLLLDVIISEFPDGLVGKFDIKPQVKEEESEEEGNEENPEEEKVDPYVLASAGYDSYYEEYYPSYFIVGEDYYFLQSGTVEISLEGENYKVEVNAVSYFGSTIHVTYEGNSLPKAFAWESQEKSNIEKVATVMNTMDYTEDYGDVYVQLKGDDFTLLLDVITSDYPNGIIGKFDIKPQPEEQTSDTYVLASAGYSDYYDSAYPSYFCLYVYNWQEGLYFLQSGTVEISLEDDVYTVEVNAVSYFGSTIHVVFHGKADQLNYDYEPNAKSNIEEQYNGVYDISKEDGVFTIMALDENYEHATYIELISSSEELPVGEFEINDSNAENTVIASPGGDAQYDYGTRFSTISDNYIDETWYIVSGKVTISREGDIYTIILEGESAKGSTIKITIIYDAGESAAVENVFENRENTRKVIEGNQVIIINNGKKYNVAGIEVK